MFLNGRNITNWGVDLNEKTRGTVEQALYEPDDHWVFREGGAIHHRPGIEARAFYFADSSESRSAAEDGGLIELRAFRAHAKKARDARLDEFKAQPQYGIA
jgi:hypothetical protein